MPVAPLLAELAAILLVPLLRSMPMLHWKPRRADLHPEARAPKPIFFVERPRFMAPATSGGEKVPSRARVRCVFIGANAETLDGFFRLCQARCLKRGHLTKEENWSSSLLLYACAHVWAGRCRGGHRPAWMGSGEHRHDSRLTNTTEVANERALVDRLRTKTSRLQAAGGVLALWVRIGNPLRARRLTS